MAEKRVLVCGDRNWSDLGVIVRELKRVKPDVVISGAASGADTLGVEAAKLLGIQRVSFPALWKQYGKAAGPIRNQTMLDVGKPTLVLAFHKNLSASKGTKDMLRRAEKAGVPFEIWEG